MIRLNVYVLHLLKRLKKKKTTKGTYLCVQSCLLFQRLRKGLFSESESGRDGGLQQVPKNRFYDPYLSGVSNRSNKPRWSLIGPRHGNIFLLLDSDGVTSSKRAQWKSKLLSPSSVVFPEDEQQRRRDGDLGFSSAFRTSGIALREREIIT